MDTFGLTRNKIVWSCDIVRSNVYLKFSQEKKFSNFTFRRVKFCSFEITIIHIWFQTSLIWGNCHLSRLHCKLILILTIGEKLRIDFILYVVGEIFHYSHLYFKSHSRFLGTRNPTNLLCHCSKPMNEEWGCI